MEQFIQSMRKFSDINLARCIQPIGFNHRLNDWSVNDWLVATLGELGEAANIAKKLRRYESNMGDMNKETQHELMEAFEQEIADTFIYLNLLAQAAGIDLGIAVVSKFNRDSIKHGVPHRMQ